MVSYFIAGVQIVKMVSNRGRQVIPIAPFSKHYTDHHIHLQSFQVHVKAEVFDVLTSQFLVQRFFSSVVNREE